MLIGVFGVLVVGTSLTLPATQNTPPPGYKATCTDARCHGEYAKAKVIHAPVATATCDVCHESVDAAAHKFKLARPEPDLCLSCHKDFLKGFDYLHGPVAAGACTMCHTSHASNHPALLMEVGTALCLQCHETMEDRLADSPYKHVPATEDCLFCHNPHGADNRLHLIDRPPALCLECHDGISDIMDDATVQHDALTIEKSCTNCHNPHASVFEHNLLKQPMDLCLSCHDKELDSGEDKLIAMAQLLKDNPDHHGPIREKNCTACHLVHGGDHFRLLIAPYPAVFYAPFAEETYALCFECHDVERVLDEKTEELTDFRNGDRNLHFLHVNRKVKGRTCRACHNTHASTRAKHITESVPFGDWALPVNFEPSESGGSCQPGCHKLYRYDRENAVVNIPD